MPSVCDERLARIKERLKAKAKLRETCSPDSPHTLPLASDPPEDAATQRAMRQAEQLSKKLEKKKRRAQGAKQAAEQAAEVEQLCKEAEARVATEAIPKASAAEAEAKAAAEAETKVTSEAELAKSELTKSELMKSELTKSEQEAQSAAAAAQIITMDAVAQPDDGRDLTVEVEAVEAGCEEVGVAVGGAASERTGQAAALGSKMAKPTPSVPCGDSCKTNTGSGEAVWTSTGKFMTETQVANTKGVVMLVDNSNAWISGKAAAASRLGLRTDSDPRWRLHVGKLFAVAMDKIGRDQNDHACVRIFGSTPPPADGVWKRMSTSGERFEVDLTPRSKVTNKEKIVDHKFCQLMTADYSRLDVCRMHQIKMDVVESREYVICSGDRDYLAVTRAALGLGFAVHIFSFARALASDYVELQKSYNEKMTITLLDDYLPRSEGELDHIGFTEDEWKLGRSSIPLSRTLVFHGPNLVEKIDLITRFREQLVIPTYIYQSDDAIFLVSHYVLEHKLFDDLFEEAQNSVGGNGDEMDVRVIGMPTYNQLTKADPLILKDLEVKLPTPKIFNLLAEEASSENDAAADQWGIAGANKEQAKIDAARKQQSTQKAVRRCKWREFCRLDGCRAGGLNMHTEREMNFFNSRMGGKGIRLQKLTECTIKGHTKSQPGSYKNCAYRHEWEPVMCTVCLGFSHPPLYSCDDAKCACVKEACHCKTPEDKYGAKHERAQLISSKQQEALLAKGYLSQTCKTCNI